jgi:hypothetical protein
MLWVYKSVLLTETLCLSHLHYWASLLVMWSVGIADGDAMGVLVIFSVRDVGGSLVGGADGDDVGAFM